jgi:RNase P/RNase MRP subunit p29
MTLTYNFISQKVSMSLRSPESEGVTHQVELGESPAGNITRIDNALEKIPERLESAKRYMEDLHKQMEAAKEELKRPFPQAKELEEKSARLAELDILLNMDNEKRPGQGEQEEQEQENELQDEAKSSLSREEPSEFIALDPDMNDTAAVVEAKENNAPVSLVLDERQIQPAAAAMAKILERTDGEAEFHPQKGQRVVFHPSGGTVKLSGMVVSSGEETVTVQAGSKRIPVYKDKGVFELERVEQVEQGPAALGAAFAGIGAGRVRNGFER